MHITPWQPTIDPHMVGDLRRRLAETRWADQVVGDWSQGTPQRALRALLTHWQSGYDWAQAATRAWTCSRSSRRIC